MNKTTGIVLAVVVIAGLGWWWFSSSKVQAPTTETGQVQGTSETNTFVDNSKDSAVEAVKDTGAVANTAPAGVTVTYTASGFSPATVTVKQGTKVTFVDKSGSGMWVGSADHPTHTVYAGTTKNEHCPDTSGTAFDQCAVSASYSFVFNKVGTWGYHNHVNAGAKGTVVVTP